MKKFTFVFLLCSILVSTGKSQQPKWSFGFEYSPSILSTTIIDIWFPPSVYYQSIIETKSDAYFSYLIHPKVAITASFGITEKVSEYRYERYWDYDSGDNYPPDSNGYISNESINILKFGIGLKYYFKQFEIKKVRPFTILEFGKQIAKVTDDFTDLFEEPDDSPPTENEDEYYSDLNSPDFLTAGFGAEYTFNESLSLYATYRIQYEKLKAEYNYYYQYAQYYDLEEQFKEREEIQVKNWASIGLNFYF
tara:strand:- start:27755 stop:28504 length:750 start_codon:yes stop_codon:yes gene_type:complete